MFNVFVLTLREGIEAFLIVAITLAIVCSFPLSYCASTIAPAPDFWAVNPIRGLGQAAYGSAYVNSVADFRKVLLIDAFDSVLD